MIFQININNKIYAHIDKYTSKFPLQIGYYINTILSACYDKTVCPLSIILFNISAAQGRPRLANGRVIMIF